VDLDLVIVGGGPAGVSTALFLMAAAPWLTGRIAILEKERYPREKICAGAIGARADKLLATIGVRVEVPSVAIQAELFAPEVDFFSIGTNDLTQYTLAMDRTHPRLASLKDALHPAVLRLIDATARAGRAHGKSVSICGAVASDLDALPVLVGLGITDLSVSVPAIPEVKAAIRALDASRCRELAKAALALPGSAEVRALLRREARAARAAAPTATKGTPT